jgi:hypothetical protein
MRSRTVEGFTLKRTRLVIVTKIEQNSGQVALGGKRVRMVRSSLADAAFQNLAQNHAGLFQMTLLEHDFPERAEQINSHRMFALQAGSCVIQSLVQYADGPVDIARTPEGNGQVVNHRESLGIVSPK